MPSNSRGALDSRTYQHPRSPPFPHISSFSPSFTDRLLAKDTLRASEDYLKHCGQSQHLTMADYIPLEFKNDRVIARVPAPTLALHFLAARSQQDGLQPRLDLSRLRQCWPYAGYCYDKLYALAKLLWERAALFEGQTDVTTGSTRGAYRQMTEETSALLDKTDFWLTNIHRLEARLMQVFFRRA